MIILPVYDMMLLPGVTFNFKKDVLDKFSIEEYPVGEEILFIIQKVDKRKKDLVKEDFYEIGMIGMVDSLDDEGGIRVRMDNRVELVDVEKEDGVLTASARIIPDIELMTEAERTASFKELKQRLLQFVQQFQWGVWARTFIQHWKNTTEIICAMSIYLNMTAEEKYGIMSCNSEKKRIELIKHAIYEFIEITVVSGEAESAEKQSNEKIYREAAIKKQMDFLQQQLDEMHPENESDISRFDKKIKEAGMNPEAEKEARKILNRMKQEGQNSHEYGMLYDYLDFVTTLSWKKETAQEIDLVEAEEILNERHYGLDKVKERIIQQLAVMALNKKQSGSILLFVGAPGTGKTSIGQSIAKALHREYARISLGGVRDEAEIRGHRRTYVGAMPGRIMEAMKRCQTTNPVIVLDEVDKLSKDHAGDPASALLEVLDPEQNNNFTDHYMNVPYDLSDVLFVCTANGADTIPEPLLNRMEMIPFSGYTATDKFKIAKIHLLPNAMEAMGIKKSQLKVTDDALKRIISEYTAESGVRGLKKQMDILCRQAAVQLVKNGNAKLTIGVKKVPEYLGNKGIRHDRRLKKADPGVVTGLAWTRAGGDILYIETTAIRGDGKVIITGQLGDVMKESAQIAMTLVKGLFPEEAQTLNEKTVHIHVPAGATPKDGPSAGITLVSALTSLVLNKAVPTDIAMTGEVSLRGGVMPIGGLPEKLMAAQRAGIKRVFIPYDNIQDLEEVADEVKQDLEITPVKQVEEVLKKIGLTE